MVKRDLLKLLHGLPDDAKTLRGIVNDDGAAAAAHLEAGRPVYIGNENKPGEILRKWPDGSTETVVVTDDGKIIRAATIERLATICMALKCYADDADFEREADKRLAEIPAGEREQCAKIVHEDWRTDDILKQCIDQTMLIDRYGWLLGRLQ